jgi:hypothetical protein
MWIKVQKWQGYIEWTCKHRLKSRNLYYTSETQNLVQTSENVLQKETKKIFGLVGLCHHTQQYRYCKKSEAQHPNRYWNPTKGNVSWDLEVRMMECLGLEHQAMKSSLANPHSRSGMLASTTFGAGTSTIEQNYVEQCCGLVEPWHSGPDPDPRIRTTDLRIRILLFSSVAFKMPTKNKFFQSFFFC